MRQTITTIIILLCPFFSGAQIQFFEQFNDSNFTASPRWFGDTAFYQIDSDKQLQLADSLAGSKQLLSVSSIMLKAQWSFKTRLGFNPSSSNYAEVYLAASDSILDSAPQAVFLRLGGSTDDAISLHKRQNGIETKILESTAAWLGKSSNTLSIDVHYDSTYNWIISADTSLSQNNMVQLFTIKDSITFEAKHTGVRCVYTKTRADKFWFDNFNYSGLAYQDLDLPVVTKLEVLSNRYLQLCFSEPLNKASLEQKQNYALLTSSYRIDEAEQDSLSASCVYLEIDPFLQNKNTYSLFVENIEDLTGNVIRDTTISFLYAIPEQGDVVINEFLADPSPVIGFPPNALPEYEYVELHNRSAYDWNTSGWAIEIGTTTFKILDSALIPADSFLVLTQAEALSQLSGVNALAVDMGQTALRNAGTSMVLHDTQGNLLDAVYYDSDWYRDETKANGGWSIERIDADYLCSDAQNWAASTNPIGGTPGKINSIIGETIDTLAPKALRIGLTGDSSVHIWFSEIPETGSLLDSSNYTIQPQLNVKMLYADPLSRTVNIIFETPLQESTAYTLAFIGQASDCAGNALRFDTLTFGKAELALAGDLFLNEVLFNPYTGGSDYVELYNGSKKIFDISKLRLGSFIPGTSVLDEVLELSEASFLLLPGTYVCLSKEPDALQTYYSILHPDRLLEAKDLPSLPDDAGSLVLLNANLQEIESLHYSDDLHSPALRDLNGVSLERARYDSVSASAAWYSSTSMVGFGTPGYANSQSVSTLARPPKKHLSFGTQLFSPNNDGYQDKLEIQYTFDKPNYVGSLRVFSKSGALLTTLWQNESLSSNGVFTWNGTADDGTQLKKDAYLLVFEYFHTTGDSGSEKHAIVLTY
jgi:hypothetical protein